MDAITAALTKIDVEVERIGKRLDTVAYGWNEKKGDYNHDSYTRQGATALLKELNLVGPLALDGLADADGSYVAGGAAALNRIAERWNDRGDWRQGAFAANVAKAVERLVGLS